MSPGAVVRMAVLDDWQQVARSSADWSVLDGRIDVDVFHDHLDDPDAVVERLQPYDVVAIMRERTPMPRTVLERLPNLRLLVTTAWRNASIDLEACRERGVTVCGTTMRLTGTPELTWGLVLAAHRRLETEVANMRGGGWQTTVGTELAGRTLGILGLGRLGTIVARYARAFEMDVVAWSRSLTEDQCAEHGARLADSLDDLCERADVLTLHLPLGRSSTGLVGAEQLRRLGPRGWLVNTSRGPIVDEDALVEALRSNTIAGACVDVYGDEPLAADHPLRTLPNATLTPHVGYVTEQNYERFYGGTVEDVAAWLDGEPIRVIE